MGHTGSKKGKCFLTPKPAGPPSSAPTGLGTQGPPPQSPASKKPATEGLNPGGTYLSWQCGCNSAGSPGGTDGGLSSAEAKT